MFGKHFEDAFEWDQSKPSLKLYQKLTSAHFDLNPASLMRNHLAFDVLNKDMRYLMKVMVLKIGVSGTVSVQIKKSHQI